MRLLLFLLLANCAIAQNSLVGDGFGGRLWYKPSNYTVGSYSGYSICYDGPCNTGPNQLYGWGSNGSKQLGYPAPVMGVLTPTPIPGMSEVKYYSCGYSMGVIKKDKSGWVFGQYWPSGPVKVIDDAYFIDASSSNISFVKTDGTVWSVGGNANGGFGDGTKTLSYLIPKQMLGITNAVRVANGAFATYVLLADGTVKVAGKNFGGLLGVGSSDHSIEALTAVDIIGLTDIVDIKAMTYGVLALDKNGDIFRWGGGFSGVWGDAPNKVMEFKDIVAISGCDDGYDFFVLDKDKVCYSITDPSILFYSLPPEGVPDVIDIMAGETFGYVVKSDHSLWGVGKSNGGSIWLDLVNTPRSDLTKITPEAVVGACSIDIIPSADLSSLTSSICIGSSSSFSATLLDPSYSYTWSSGTHSSSITVTPTITTTYTLVVSNGTCTATNQTTVYVSNPVSSVNSATICIGNTTTLTADATVDTFTWSTGANTKSITVSPTTKTIYTVTGSDALGCIGLATATVDVNDPKVAVNSSTICYGQSTVLNAITSGVDILTWSTGDLTNSITVTPSVTSTYTVEGKDNFGCINTQTTNVDVYHPIADFSGLSETAYPEKMILELINTSSDALTYRWSLCDNSISTNTNVSVPLIDTGNCCIKLVARKAQCLDSLTKCFYVIPEPYIIIPNVFTPNGDGANEVFRIKTFGIRDLNCVIFDRWGVKLFEWDGVKGYWDGYAKTGPATSGTYYWIVNYSTIAGISKTEKGFLTLFRD